MPCGTDAMVDGLSLPLAVALTAADAVQQTAGRKYAAVIDFIRPVGLGCSLAASGVLCC